MNTITINSAIAPTFGSGEHMFDANSQVIATVARGFVTSATSGGANYKGIPALFVITHDGYDYVYFGNAATINQWFEGCRGADSPGKYWRSVRAEALAGYRLKDWYSQHDFDSTDAEISEALLIGVEEPKPTATKTVSVDLDGLGEKLAGFAKGFSDTVSNDLADLFEEIAAGLRSRN